MTRTAECRPGGGGIPDEALPGDNVTDSVQAGTVKCAFLHPKHLTGCKQLAEPGSKFCREHGDP